mmetsp:Transcript_51982/g.165802  ORF Transcript_51982/g.165802 Transcript_51982/m.165802 type:complete len:210 (+) Transcript_51982:53-682(+)
MLLAPVKGGRRERRCGDGRGRSGKYPRAMGRARGGGAAGVSWRTSRRTRRTTRALLPRPAAGLRRGGGSPRLSAQHRAPAAGGRRSLGSAGPCPSHRAREAAGALITVQRATARRWIGRCTVTCARGSAAGGRIEGRRASRGSAHGRYPKRPSGRPTRRRRTRGPPSARERGRGRKGWARGAPPPRDRPPSRQHPELSRRRTGRRGVPR